MGASDGWASVSSRRTWYNIRVGWTFCCCYFQWVHVRHGQPSEWKAFLARLRPWLLFGSTMRRLNQSWESAHSGGPSCFYLYPSRVLSRAQARLVLRIRRSWAQARPIKKIARNTFLVVFYNNKKEFVRRLQHQPEQLWLWEERLCRGGRTHLQLRLASSSFRYVFLNQGVQHGPQVYGSCHKDIHKKDPPNF